MAPISLGADMKKGLDTITNAISSTKHARLADPITAGLAIRSHTGKTVNLEIMSCEEQNQFLAAVVRERAVDHGYISGWKLLVDANPSIIPPRLMKDVATAASIYGQLKAGPHVRPPVMLRMSIGSQSTYESIYQIGPKSLGGNAWKANKEYKGFTDDPGWNAAGYSMGISPCVAFAWIGIQKKTTPIKDTAEVVVLQLLGTIDLDVDKSSDNISGVQSGFECAARHTSAVGTPLQRAAFIGMLNYDFQHDIRPIQNLWATENNGPWNCGPADVSPEDWTAYLIGDCAALVPFAYDADYLISRTGMANGMILLHCQDLIFDIGCSNRVATVPYAEAAGVAQYGLHAGYAVAAYSATAKYILDNNHVPFGYSATMCAGPWGSFGTRYRVWERCVKYVRQLRKSDPGNLLELSSRDLILKGYDLSLGAGSEWARAMKSNTSNLMARPVVKYFVPVSDVSKVPGVIVPDLCEACASAFDKVMYSQELEEVHALEGLPDGFGRPASLAVTLRRAAMWACEAACETCACKVGYWVDQATYIILVTLMQDEATLGESEWMLQNYFVGCVALWPISIPFLLSGFDLTADLSFEDGAMGERDVVDI